MSGDTGIGRGKPPAQHRFRKGQSGNPKGRPRRKPEASDDPGVTRVTDALILEEALRPVTVREGDKAITLPAIQAAVRALAIAAMKGNRLAQRDLATLVLEAEERRVKAAGAHDAPQAWTPPPLSHFYRVIGEDDDPAKAV